jgi:hypothetical protein
MSKSKLIIGIALSSLLFFAGIIPPVLSPVVWEKYKFLFISCSIVFFMISIVFTVVWFVKDKAEKELNDFLSDLKIKYNNYYHLYEGVFTIDRGSMLDLNLSSYFSEAELEMLEYLGCIAKNNKTGFYQAL